MGQPLSGLTIPAPGQPAPAEAKVCTPGVGMLFDPTLALFADLLDDLERTRMANENRVRQLTRAVEDDDGVERGFGLTADNPVVGTVVAIVDALTAQENAAKLALCRQLRKHPLGPWLKSQHGIGEKQGARLLAAIGDPYWNDLHGRPRTVAELWAYCGYVPGQRRRKGERSNWSADAKMRAYLVAESCMKQRGHYRDVYDARKAATEGRTHLNMCVRCGPSGRPAAPGSPLSSGHRHADALRVVAKTILADLWAEAKRIHEATS